MEPDFGFCVDMDMAGRKIHKDLTFWRRAGDTNNN